MSIIETIVNKLPNSKEFFIRKEQRMKICNECEFKIIKTISKIEILDVCSKCGCPLRTKTIVANSKCPLGKW